MTQAGAAVTVDVVRVDGRPARGGVRLAINGEERTTSFKEDGLKAPAGPPMGPGNPMPAMPLGMPAPVPNFPAPQPLTMPQPLNVPRAGYQPPVTTSPTAAPVVGIPGIAAPNVQRALRVAPGVPGQNATTPPAAQYVDPAEQALRMEINRKITEVQVQRGELPPLPGTDLTPLIQPPPVPGGR